MKRLSAIFALLGILLMTSAGYLFFYRPSHAMVFQNSQDVWDPADPKGAFFFNFSSQGFIAADKPVHVKVTFFITQVLNITDLLPLRIVLPDAYAYPLKSDPQGVTYSAGEIEIKPASVSGPATGESDVIFPQSGKFGYIVFSKDKPVWITALEPYFYSVVEVAPAYIWTLAYALDSFLTICLLESGIFLEIIIFRRHIELVAGRRRPKPISRTGIYLISSVLFSFLIYFLGVSMFNMTESQAFVLAVPVGVTLFVGLIRYR
jgi:hypothetical protein